jgi:hypothetical protein
MDDPYIDTWGITRNDLLIQDLQDQIALIEPVVYNNPIFTGQNNTYQQIVGQGTININSSNSYYSNVSSIYNTNVTGSNIDISNVISPNVTFQYSPFYYSDLTTLTANSNVYLYNGNMVSNLYGYSNAYISNCSISNIYMAQGSNVTISDNSYIYQINIDNADIQNYYSSNTNISYLVASNLITSNVYASNASNCVFNSSNAYFSTSNSINNLTTTNAYTEGGNIKNFDITNNAYITYNPRVSIGTNTVTFFFDAGAIPDNLTTYKLQSFMFDQLGHLTVTYLLNNVSTTYVHTIFRI